MFSQRDYYEYGTIRNISIMVPFEGSMIDPNMGPVEKEEMMRANKIDIEVAQKHKKEKRNFKGY